MRDKPQQYYRDRDKEIYERYLNGESKEQLAMLFNLSVSRIEFVLGREMNKDRNL